MVGRTFAQAANLSLTTSFPIFRAWCLSAAVIKTTSAFADNLFFLDGFCIGGRDLNS